MVDGYNDMVPAGGAHGGGQTTRYGREFVRQVPTESQEFWLAHTRARDGLIKFRSGPGGTMA